MGLCPVMYSYGIIGSKSVCRASKQRERELFFPPVIAILHYRHLDPGGTVATGGNREAERASKLMCLSERERERWKKKRQCPEKKKKKNE